MTQKWRTHLDTTSLYTPRGSSSKKIFQTEFFSASSNTYIHKWLEVDGRWMGDGWEVMGDDGR